MPSTCCKKLRRSPMRRVAMSPTRVNGRNENRFGRARPFAFPLPNSCRFLRPSAVWPSASKAKTSQRRTFPRSTQTSAPSSGIFKATETELRELLKTVRERTQKASEIMEIYTEITKVRGEIDRIQGRIQYLSQMTSLSTITLELVPDVLAAPIVEPGWQPVATIKNASRSLVNSLKGVVDVLIWVVLYILPLGLIFVFFALIIRAVWKRLRKVRATTT